jgi:hypothetical protein
MKTYKMRKNVKEALKKRIRAGASPIDVARNLAILNGVIRQSHL